MCRSSAVYPRVLVALVAFALQFLGSSAAAQSLGQIAFTHVDGDCRNLATCAFSLRLVNPQNPVQQVTLTRFPASVLVDAPVWSKDFRSLAFASTLNLEHSLEAPYSVFAMNADGTNLRQVTGRGVLGQFPGPTATVQGRAVPKPAHSPKKLLPGTFPNCPDPLPPEGIAGPCQLNDGTYLIPGTLVTCSVTAQGTLPTLPCRQLADGSYTLPNVPVLSSWVRGFGFATYHDPKLNIPPTQLNIPPTPVLSMGFTNIGPLQPGQVANATVTIRASFLESVQPSWSLDGSKLIVTAILRETSPQFDLEKQIVTWKQDTTTALALVNTDGTLRGTVPLPFCAAAICEVSGSDWSPIENRIVFALNALSISQVSGIAVMNPDGTNAQLVFQLRPNPLGPVRLVKQARWSPDARRIAFTVDTLAQGGIGLVETYDLFVVNVNGTNLIQLTRNQSGQTIQGFSWSPDGSTIAFDIINTAQLSIGGNFPIPVPVSADIFAIKADGRGSAMKLTTDGRSFGPAWRGKKRRGQLVSQ